MAGVAGLLVAGGCAPTLETTVHGLGFVNIRPLSTQLSPGTVVRMANANLLVSGNPLQRASDDEIRAQWLGHLRTIFPNFDERSIRQFMVRRGVVTAPPAAGGREK